MFDWIVNAWPIIWKVFGVTGLGVGALAAYLLQPRWFPAKLQAFTLMVAIGALSFNVVYGWGVKDEHARMVAEQIRSGKIVKEESNDIAEKSDRTIDSRTPDRVQRDRSTSPDNRQAKSKK